MKTAYALDTNAYALLFQTPKSEARDNLEKKLTNNGVMSFYIPEIVSMEIHSVLGKFRRGGAKEQHESCIKHIIQSDKIIACTHTCYLAPRPAWNQKYIKLFWRCSMTLKKARLDTSWFITARFERNECGKRHPHSTSSQIFIWITRCLSGWHRRGSECKWPRIDVGYVRQEPQSCLHGAADSSLWPKCLRMNSLIVLKALLARFLVILLSSVKQ